MTLSRSTASAALALAIAAGACTIDTGELAPIDDYRDWDKFEVSGEIAGHGDTFRIMYVNDLARGWVGAGPYPLGSVVVKEIYELDEGGPGELRYLAIARKLEAAPADAELHGGWLWTLVRERDSVGGDEQYRESCWSTCHAAAPADGLFHDFGY